MKHKAFIQRNSATVLAIAGVVGVVATVVTTTRAAPKAIRLLNEAKELYGQEAHDRIIESLAIEKAEKVSHYACGVWDVIDLSVDSSNCGPTLLFYDRLSERFFEATLEAVLSAEYHINRNYILQGVVTLDELYDFFGLSHVENGDKRGWTPTDEGEYWIDFNHKKAQMEDGTTFYIIDIIQEPFPDIDIL